MKIIGIYILLCIGLSYITHAQDIPLDGQGTVSHVTTANIYVSFPSTNGININDTLLVLINKEWRKALKVEMVSSKSCITTAIVTEEIKLGFKVEFPTKTVQLQNQVQEISQLDSIKKADSLSKNISQEDSISIAKENAKKAELEKVKQTFNLRLTVSSNGSMDEAEKQYNRIRTSLNFEMNNINGGKVSIENYLTYRRRFGVGVTQSTFKEDFKVYTMAVNIDANKNTSIAFGRRINNRMANMGAIDGVQSEYKYKTVVFGAFAGFRPSDLDYGFDKTLLQFGGVISHETDKGKGQMQTSLAFAEQKNNGNTDRRFLYFQHSNSIFKTLNLFYSLELDIYQKVNNVVSNKFNLTSTYISLRYKPFKKLSITTAYDNRKNVIYYETYRTYVEQLLTQETRQGYRLSANYNMLKTLFINASGFYRYQQSRPEPTKNYVVNVTKSAIMGPGSSLNFNFNAMNTFYFDGNIYGASFTKELFKSKMSTELNYRKVNYSFVNPEQPNMVQQIFGVSLNVFGKKSSSLLLSYEGTFEPLKKYNRYYVTYSHRIRSKS
jgi:hypothetical protein